MAQVCVPWHMPSGHHVHDSRSPDGSDRGDTSPEVWLSRITDHIVENGLDDASMRRLAAVAGTSHRMLGYYFGSADGVLGGVLQQLRARERRTLFAAATSRRDAMELAWRYYTSPQRILEMQIFYLLAGKAVRAPDSYSSFLDSIVSNWTEAMTQLGVSEGVPEQRAELEARLLTASARGLLLDRLLTADTAVVDAAFTHLLDVVLGQG